MAQDMYRLPDGRVVPGSSLTQREKEVGSVKVNDQQSAPSAPQQQSADMLRGYADPTNLLDPQGRLKSQYSLQARPDIGFVSNMDELNKRLSGIQLDKRGLEAVRNRALTEGPSDWQKAMLQKQGIEEQNALERAAAEGRGATSSAYSDMARRGGLSSGARERLAQQGARNLSQGRQQALRQGMGQRADIAISDEQQRLALLSQLPGMEIQALQPELQKTSLYASTAENEAARRQNLDLSNRQYQSGIEQFNLSNTLGEVGRQDAARLAKYQEQLKADAAAQQAKATAASGGGKK